MRTNHNPEAYNYARLICQRVTEEMIWVRQQMNLSRCELARRGGLHPECICGLERGDNFPTLFLACRTCHGLEVRACDLITAAETGDRSIYGVHWWYGGFGKGEGRSGNAERGTRNAERGSGKWEVKGKR